MVVDEFYGDKLKQELAGVNVKNNFNVMPRKTATLRN